MKALWGKIESFLERHDKDVLGNLNLPISKEELNDLNTRMKVKPPSDLIECLKIHNGQPPAYKHYPLFTNWHLLESSQILERYRRDCEEIDYVDSNFSDGYTFDNGVKKVFFSEKWIPITATFSSGSFFFIDMDPAPGGHSGQIVYKDDENNHYKIVSKNFSEWFTTCVNARCSNKDSKLFISQESLSSFTKSNGGGMKNQQSVSTLMTLANGADLINNIARGVMGNEIADTFNGEELNTTLVHSLAQVQFQANVSKFIRTE